MRLLKELWHRASAHFLPRPPTLSKADVEAGTLAGLRSLIESCPSCNQQLSGHSYALAAMAVFDSTRPRSAYDLLKAVSRRDWSEIASYNEWEGGMDDAILFVILCPTGRATVVAVEDPYMLGAKDTIIQTEVLEVEESKKLASAFPDKWRLIP